MKLKIAGFEYGLDYLGTHCVRGQGLSHGQTQRVRLYDADFTTAYRLREVRISNQDPMLARESSLIVLREEMTWGYYWNWNDGRQIGWARWGGDTTAKPQSDFHYVDPENMNVDDLYLHLHSEVDNAKVNWACHFDKYEINEWRGAQTMVTQGSQAWPQDN
jgi:hypothetical protein